jgi:2-methylisocitrate lyase-like PEP mutase family enzyme
VIASGSCDALSARVMEKTGFEVVRLCGFVMTASLLGCPDVGPLGESEMIDKARHIVQAVGVRIGLCADLVLHRRISVRAAALRSV